MTCNQLLCCQKRGRVLHHGFQTPRNRWKHEAAGPRFWHVFSNETMRNYVVTCFLKSNNDELRSVSCPSPKKHIYMHDELWLCSWRPTMSEEGALSVRFREPKTFCEEEELVEKAVPSSTKDKNKWALSVFGEWQFARTIKVPVLDSYLRIFVNDRYCMVSMSCVINKSSH